MKRKGRATDDQNLQRKLLSAVSQDLSLPLLQIKTSLEAGPTSKAQLEALLSSASSGLRLVEAYRLALAIDETPALELEPVAVSSVMSDVAHQIEPYAQAHDTRLEVDVAASCAPVLAHKPSLRAAIECLSVSLIRAQSAQAKRQNYRLVLAGHRSGDQTIAAGVFSNIQGLTDQSLRAARGLVGRSRQPLKALPAGTASGILIADMLCASMWQPLRSAAHKHLNGLATALPISHQIRFM